MSRLVFSVSRQFTRQFSSKKLGQTSVFMQTGLKIRELPLVVKKVNDVLKLEEFNNNGAKVSQENNQIFNHTNSKSDRDTIEQMNKTISVTDLFHFLEVVPAEKVTPPVAINALKRIIHLNNNQARRRLEINGPNENLPPKIQNQSGSFLRFAFMNMLLDIVYRSRDPKIILDGLKVVCQDDFSEDNEQIVRYKERIYEETLDLITEGLFSLVQVCEAVITLSKFYSNDKERSLQMADNLWSGIMDKAPKELNIKSVPIVFATLPHLSSSRDLVYKMVSSKACDMWQEFQTKDILEILRVLNLMGSVQCGYCQGTTLSMITQWLSVNVHKLTEQELLAVVISMDRMEYHSDTLTKVLERVMKVKGVTIKETDLVAAICDYCDHFRIRSKTIFEASGEYFIANSSSLNTPQINSIAKIYGKLNYHPPNGFKFWEKMEGLIEEKFVEFPPKALVDLLMTFIYIERFPLNIAWKIFNPCFYDRIDSQVDNDAQHTWLGLDLIHTSMRLEKSRQYNVDYFVKNQKNSVKYVAHWNRKLTRISSELLLPLGNIVGDVKRVDTNVLLSGLVRHPIYVADLMIYPSRHSSLFRFGATTYQKNSQIVIILIHPPTHYDKEGKTLIGREQMRIRQLKKLGFKVMPVSYNEANKLITMPIKLQGYLQNRYNEAIKD